MWCNIQCMGRRFSLTLEPADEIALQPFTHDGPARDALTGLVASTPGGAALATDAAVIRALIRVGVDTVGERVLERGYAEMAAEYRAHDEERRRMRARRAARDEARG